MLLITLCSTQHQLPQQIIFCYNLAQLPHHFALCTNQLTHPCNRHTHPHPCQPAPSVPVPPHRSVRLPAQTSAPSTHQMICSHLHFCQTTWKQWGHVCILFYSISATPTPIHYKVFCASFTLDLLLFSLPF